MLHTYYIHITFDMGRHQWVLQGPVVMGGQGMQRFTGRWRWSRKFPCPVLYVLFRYCQTTTTPYSSPRWPSVHMDTIKSGHWAGATTWFQNNLHQGLERISRRCPSPPPTGVMVQFWTGWQLQDAATRLGHDVWNPWHPRVLTVQDAINYLASLATVRIAEKAQMPSYTTIDDRVIHVQHWQLGTWHIGSHFAPTYWSLQMGHVKPKHGESCGL